MLAATVESCNDCQKYRLLNSHDQGHWTYSLKVNTKIQPQKRVSYTARFGKPVPRYLKPGPVSTRSLLAMQNLGPIPDPVNQNLHFNKVIPKLINALILCTLSLFLWMGKQAKKVKILNKLRKRVSSRRITQNQASLSKPS